MHVRSFADALTAEWVMHDTPGMNEVSEMDHLKIKPVSDLFTDGMSIIRTGIPIKKYRVKARCNWTSGTTTLEDLHDEPHTEDRSFLFGEDIVDMMDGL